MQSLLRGNLRRGFLVVVTIGFAMPELLSAQTPLAGIVEQDVVTGKGGDRELHAEIAYPKDATGMLPAIVWIHGGGWISGNYKPAPVLEMAKHGYVVASIEYRTSNLAPWPAQIQDCKLGVRWLRANAALYHADPNRIAAWGGSAGSHLANCLGTMTDPKLEGDGGYPGVSSAVQAVIDSFGPTDFTDPKSVGANPTSLMLVEKLMGAPYAQNPDLWKSACPIAFVKAGDPPFFIIHGDSDQTVPVAQATSFDAALTQAGVPHQLLIIKNCGHDGAANPGTAIDPSRDEVDRRIYSFLAKYLKGP